MKKRIIGFSLVELIVVITVIGILAAIVIVSYSGSQNRANDGAITSDLTNLADQMDIFRTDSGSVDQFPLSVGDLTTLGAKVTRTAYRTDSVANNLLVCVAADGKTFALAALSKSGNVIAVTNEGIKAFPQPASSFSSSSCSSAYSMNLVSAGWQSGSWQSWIGT
jgi:prepilin-type N-terminal cleavage/methylation domain-containing protein